MATGEQLLIATHLAPLATHPAADGLIDDVAVIDLGENTVLTKDILVADVHFRDNDSPADVAWKALAVNVSDLVAKGARPGQFLLGITLPNTIDADPWMAEFTAGLSGAMAHFGVDLLGGDLVASPTDLMISVTMIGSALSPQVPRRQNGGDGDILLVSGPVGAATIGLMYLQGDPRLESLSLEAAHQAINRYLRPQPSLAVAPLVAKFASASMDVSDGLLGDLTSLCSASGLGAVVDMAAMPFGRVAEFAAIDIENRLMLLNGGDDYCVLLAVPEAQFDDMMAEAATIGQHLFPIGTLTSELASGQVIDAAGIELEQKSAAYSHF